MTDELLCEGQLTALSAASVGLAVASAPVMLMSLLLWGAALAALPMVLQSRVVEHAARPDLASAIYVVMYQVGIAAGATIGGTLTDRLSALALTGAALVALAVVGYVLTERGAIGAKAGRTAHGRPQ